MVAMNAIHAVPSNAPMSGIAEGYRRGDPEALRSVYRHYAPVVYGYLHRKTQSAADSRDLAHEVFEVAFKPRTRARFAAASSLETYVVGIAKNVLMHHLRSQRVEAAAADRIAGEAASCEADAVSADDLAARADASRVLHGLLSELSERERAFFVGHMMERPPRRVTAERFGISEDQVRYLETRLRARALGYLRRIGYLESKPGSPTRGLRVVKPPRGPDAAHPACA